jgi:hypothetical protein
MEVVGCFALTGKVPMTTGFQACSVRYQIRLMMIREEHCWSAKKIIN